jgi:hypothetical protein
LFTNVLNAIVPSDYIIAAEGSKEKSKTSPALQGSALWKWDYPT